MEGRLFQRGKRKTWYLVFDLPKKPGEKRKQQFVRIGNLPRTQALAKKREILQKLDRGEWVDERADLKVEKFFESWLDAIEPNIAATTHARYKGLVNRYFVPVIGDVMLRKVTPEDVRKNRPQARRDKALASARLHAHRALHTAFTWQSKRTVNMLEENVVSLVRAPKVESRTVSPFSHDKVKAVIDAVRGTRLEAPVVFASLTGLHRGELLALKWQYVNLDEGSIFVAESLEHTRARGVRFKAPKSVKSRASVPLAPECVELLRRHKDEQKESKRKAAAFYADLDLVFPNPDGAPWPPDSFSVQFGRLVKGAGCQGFRLHDLRHGFASLMLAGGVSLKEVSGLLRHSSESLTLSTDAHLTVGAGRAAVSDLARSLLCSEVAGSP